MLKQKWHLFSVEKEASLPVSSWSASPPHGGAIMWMIASTVLLSITAACQKQLTRTLGAFEIGFLRSAIGVAYLMPILAWCRFAPLNSANFKFHVLRAGFGAGASVLLLWGMAALPLAEVTGLTYTTPIFTIILAALIFGERLTSRVWAATITGFFGCLLMLYVAPNLLRVPALIVVCSALSQAVVSILVKFMSKTDSSLGITAWLSLLMTVILAVPAFFEWRSPPIESWVLLGVLAASSTAAQFCMTRSMQTAPLNVVVPYDYLRLVWAACLGYVFFSEVTGWHTWLGSSLIFVAVLIAGASSVAARLSRLGSGAEAQSAKSE